VTNSVLDIAKHLISCPSVTPDDAGAQVYLTKVLEELGFEVHQLPFGEGDEHVPNIFARIGTAGPHICYGGHTDVVPPGPEDQWTYGPFNPHIEDGVLYGRGASDMKGSVAAFVAACANYIAQNGAPKNGSISLLITGDEEGPAINGTIKVLEWMEENGHLPNVALVGEPTNPIRLGEEIKIGRRGSLTGTLKVKGKQGHVAYQHLADNPLPRLTHMLDVLARHEFDQGTEYFPPTNLEITTIDVGNKASNVIPNAGMAVFNIRFNDLWNAATLEAELCKMLDALGYEYDLVCESGSQSFLTQPGEWTELVKQAVTNVTGSTPDYTTNGGTSDARFFAKYCPIIEFGPINATIHQIDENSPVDALEDLVKVYEEVLRLYLAG